MKSIFVINDTIICDILQQYIDMSLSEKGTKGCLDWCFCINFNSAICFTKKSSLKEIDESSDEILKWIYKLSINYLRSSGVDDSKLSLNFVECIYCNEPLLLKNTKDYNIIYHFTGKYGYITTHNDKLNYLVNDNKYILLSFDKIE